MTRTGSISSPLVLLPFLKEETVKQGHYPCKSYFLFMIFSTLLFFFPKSRTTTTRPPSSTLHLSISFFFLETERKEQRQRAKGEKGGPL